MMPRPPEEFESRVRVRLAGDRAREERDDPDRASFGVRRGGTFWHYDPASGAGSNEGRADIGSGIGDELSTLLDLGAAIGMLDFDPPAAGRWAGRETLSVRAVPRDHEFRGYMRHGHGADELLLEIDVERGVVLCAESRADGEPFAITEAVEIVFDEPFPEETFVFTPPPGLEGRGSGGGAGERRRRHVGEGSGAVSARTACVLTLPSPAHRTGSGHSRR